MAASGGKSAATSGFGKPIEVHPLAYQQVCGLKFLPVESHADPCGIWGQRHVVFNDERALMCIALSGRNGPRSSPRFFGRKQGSHAALASHGYKSGTGLFGQGCDLKKAGDAAAIGGIGLDEAQV